MPAPVRVRPDTWRLDAAFLAICVAALGIAVLYPSLRLAAETLRVWLAGELQVDRGFIAQGWLALWNTAVLGIGTVVFSGLIGTALAFLLTRYDFPGRLVLSGIAFLPFALPPLVGVLSFWYIIGHDGLVPRAFEAWIGADISLRGLGAVLVIHAYSFYVFFYAMAGAALQSLDVSQLEAARTLGAGRLRVFFLVTLPQLRPALIGASLLAFMSSGASFSAPYFFGQDFPVLSTQIFFEQTQFNEKEPMDYTLLLALLSLGALAVFRSTGPSRGGAGKGVRRTLKSPTGRYLAGAASWLGAGIILFPHATILWLSLVDHQQWHTELVPTAFPLENYTRVFTSGDMLEPVFNSIWMSALSTAACLAVALPAGYLIGRRRPGARWVNLMLMLPWALPGTVVAINLIVAFNDAWLPEELILYGTVWMLPLAYFVRNVPLMGRMATAAIEPFDAGLVEAARTLGATPAYAFVRVVMPLLAPAVIAGAALVFTLSLGEFVASILLYSPANRPISMMIFEQWNGSGIGAAFAYSVVLMVLVTVTFLVSRRFADRPM